jgi:hypothetical protein
VMDTLIEKDLKETFVTGWDDFCYNFKIC